VQSIAATKTFFILSCVLILVQTACSSNDATPNPVGTGGSSSTTANTDPFSTGGDTASPSTDSGGTSATTGGSAAAGGATTVGGSTGTPSPYAGKLVINELVASNKTGPTDEGGAYPDWFELYNMSSESISLSGFYVSDTLDNLTRARLDASLTIAAGGVLLLWADGDIDQGVLHMPFALSAAGESLYLSDPEQKLIDSVEWTQASADASYARLPDGAGAFAWCSSGTPRTLNGQACPN
jgi:hypothetical protein